MDKVLLAKARFLPMAACQATSLVVALMLFGPLPAFGQDAKAKPAAKAKAAAPPPAATDATKKAEASAPTPKDAPTPKAADGDTAKADDAENSDEPADPIQTRKEDPAEIYRDPRAEALLDVNAFPEVKVSGLKIPSQGDLESFRRMAGNNVGGTPDLDLIRRVVDYEVVQLTNHNNIQAVLNPPAGSSPNSTTAKAIQNATTLLQEAIFAARSAKNTRFRDEYNKILIQKLTPLLKNHLIPRIQAMLILGQSGNPNAMRLYLSELKDEKQTALVKLWALRGISNARHYGGIVMAADQEVSTARAVAELLTNEPDLPWPVQLRALEVLTEFRQGHSAATPRKLEIASVVMQYLTNTKLKLEVRAEAARALGVIQISQSIADYNYYAIAHQAGTIAAELGDLVGKMMTENPNRAEYYCVYLIGPILQAFDGTTGAREGGGLLKSSNEANKAKIQEISNLVHPIAKTSVELVRSGRGQVPARQKELAGQVAALKDYLQKNPPKSLSLLPDGKDAAGE